MRKLKILLLLVMMITFSLGSIQAQCPLSTNPYGTGAAPTFNTVQVDISNGCNWTGEDATITGVTAGQTYAITLAAGDPDTYITVYDTNGTTVLAFGTITDGGPAITFSPLGSGNVTVVTASSAATCGTVVNTCRIMLLECTSCPTPPCGNAICETDYCTCDLDCPCPTIPIDFIDYSSGSPAISTTGAFAYCRDNAVLPGTAQNPTPEAVYIPIGITTNLTCVTEFDVSTSVGNLLQSDGTNLNPITTTPGFIVFWLEVTDADGASATITVTDATNGPGGCTATLNVPITTATNYTTDAATTCPGAPCQPPNGTAIYDCATNSIDVTITDVGTPSPGGSFSMSVDGTALPAQTITGLTTYTFGPLTPDQSYTISITDGITAGCDVGFFNLYPACNTVCAGGTDLIADGSFETGGAWTDTSTDGAGAATGINVIGTTNPLFGTNAAWFGGYGGSGIGSGTTPYTTTLSQSVTIPAGGTAVNLEFWGQFAVCDSPSDVFTLTVDGNTELTLNGGDVSCGGEWILYSIDLSAYADGGAHTIQLQMVEQATNGAQTNFFVDEMILENCVACGTVLTLSGNVTANDDQEVSDNIVTTEVINTANIIVDRDAGMFVQMDPGFQAVAVAGSEYTAFIDGCGNLKPQAPNAFNEKSANNGSVVEFKAYNEGAKTASKGFKGEEYSPLKEFSKVTINNVIPNEIQLSAIPNPTRDITTINFTSDITSDVSLELYDVQGKMVKVLFDANVDSKTNYQVQLDTRDLESGIYIVRLNSAEGQNNIKLVVNH